MAAKTKKSAKPKTAQARSRSKSDKDQSAHRPAAPSTAPAALSADQADLALGTKKDVMKIKDVLAAVVQKTGAKKQEAKPVIDAALAEIAAALAQGRSLSLPPLGNLRVAKMHDKGAAKMLVVKLRLAATKTAQDQEIDPLADDEADR